mgnify:CR=1 FL=1
MLFALFGIPGKSLGKIVQVAVDVKHPKVKGEYSYLVPEEIINNVKIGSRVIVPFRNKKKQGFVVDFIKEEFLDEKIRGKLKSIIEVDEVALPEEMVELSKSLSEYYGAFLIDFLKLMFPAKSGIRKTVVYKVNKDFKNDLKSQNQKLIYQYLLQKDHTSIEEISKETGLAKEKVRAVLEALYKKNAVFKEYEAVNKAKIKYSLEYNAEKDKIFLSPEQENAIKIILKNLEGEKKPVLLFGVTGSGKTEVYLRIIEKVILSGKGAIFLVPEISLTPQMVDIFQNRFPGNIAILHSGLSEGEKFDEWLRIAKGEVNIVIGARSAIFAPVKNLGVIVIDEEHETSYKQSEYPFYDARIVARLRAKKENALLIFGSATPSLESIYEAKKGNFLLVKMRKRINNKPLPVFEIIDMRQELKSGNKSIFSRRLVEELQHTISRKEQAILFLNRRGYSTFVLCKDCGFVAKCPHCDISLIYHLEDKTLRCHYCDYREAALEICPKCQGSKIGYYGSGTEKIEEEIKKLIPEIIPVRIDADVLSKKGVLLKEKLLEFKTGRANVLIGTQTITKGLDFPNVSLIGILLADVTLNIPDFRAGERTFQLITQVAGRAGRGKTNGKVIVQTFCPESFVIDSAVRYDINNFIKQELKIRREFNYPPFCHLLNITFSGKDKFYIEEFSKKTYFTLKKCLEGDVEFLGPIPALRHKIKDNFRYNLLLKSKKYMPLILAQKKLKDISLQEEKVNISWDLDPYDLL